MHRRTLLHTFGILSLALSAILGCKKGDGGASGSGSGKHAGTAQDPFVIGMSQCNLGEPWRVQMNEDVKNAAAKNPNLKMVFKDAQNDSLTQRAQVEELVNQGIDLLIISPKESAPLTKPVSEAFKKGIPVIVLDRAVEGNDFTTFIGADNKKIGRAAGEWIGKSLNGTGKIVELKGLMTSKPGQDRHDGFLEGIGKTKDVKVVFEADMQWLEPNARKEMESALNTQKEIDVVYAHNDPGAHGAWLAAKAAGREKSVKFVGIDALPHEGVKYVKDGILDATFMYPTGGTEAIDTALKILKKEQAPKTIVLGTRIYTKENVDKGGEELK